MQTRLWQSRQDNTSFRLIYVSPLGISKRSVPHRRICSSQTEFVSGLFESVAHVAAGVACNEKMLCLTRYCQSSIIPIPSGRACRAPSSPSLGRVDPGCHIVLDASQIRGSCITRIPTLVSASDGAFVRLRATIFKHEPVNSLCRPDSSCDQQ